jgi:hypothetical protein
MIFNLGQLHCAAGDWDKAEPMLREALERSRRILGDMHPDTRVRWQRLVECLRELGRDTDAAELIRQSSATQPTSKPMTAR